MQDYLKAIEDYNQVVKLDPKDGISYYYRGVAKYKLNDKENACEDWNKAVLNSYTKASEYIDKICLKK